MTAHSPASGAAGTPTAHRWRVLAVLCVAVFAINVDTTLVNVALPTLVRELHASTSQLQWVVDAYNLAFAALVLAAGSLSDRFGRKGALLCGLAIFGPATAVGARHHDGSAHRCSRRHGRRRGDRVPEHVVDPVERLHRSHRAGKAIGVWGATTGIGVAFGPSWAGSSSSISGGGARSSRWRPRRGRHASRRPRCRPPEILDPPSRPRGADPVDRRDRTARLHDHRGTGPRLGRRRTSAASSSRGDAGGLRGWERRQIHPCSTSGCSRTCGSRRPVAR